MCPAVKKQFLNLYAAFGFKPTKDIIVPGYKPVPPGSIGPTPVPVDIEEEVRKTKITVIDKEGKPVEMTVEELLTTLSDDMIEAKRKYLVGYIEDSDSDQEPDNETIYLNPQDMIKAGYW